jgi:hypothetical protein
MDPDRRADSARCVVERFSRRNRLLMTEPSPNSVRRGDLTRTVLAVLLIGTLIASSFWILRPFLLALVWATMVVVATWPLMLSVQTALRRRSLAVMLMTAAMLLVFIAPLTLAIQSLVENMDTVTQTIRSLATREIPPPPQWVAKIPLAGSAISERWTDVAAGGKEGLVAQLAPYAGDAARWLAGQFGNIGLLVLHFLLTVLHRGDPVCARRDGERRGDPFRTPACGRSRRARRASGRTGDSRRRARCGRHRIGADLPCRHRPRRCRHSVCGVTDRRRAVSMHRTSGPLLVLAPAVIWLFYTGATGAGRRSSCGASSSDFSTTCCGRS